MRKTHADKIREAITDLVIASPREIMDWIKRHYPDDPVKPKSYRSDIIGCSINHTSTHHYPSVPKFLWFDEKTKKYRLAEPKEAAVLEKSEIDKEANTKTEQILFQGIPVAKLSVTGQIQVPVVIRETLGLKVGDILAFVINDDGVLELRKARVKIEIE